MNDQPAESEYKKNNKIRKEDIQNLLNWADMEKHLPKISESEMILFFNACSCSMEYTKTVIDNYYTSRSQCPEFFNNREDVFEDNFVDTVIFYPLPKTPDGTNILFGKLLDTSISKYDLDRSFKITMMTYDLLLKKEGASNGHYLIADLGTTQLAHVTKIKIVTLKKIAWYMQEALPFKRLEMHIINVHPAVDLFFNLIKPYLKKELMDIIFLHSSADALFEIFPKSCIPKDYGGNGPAIATMHGFMKKELAAYLDYFKTEEKTRRVNENLRTGQPKNLDDLFGIEGSFKKLDID